MYSGSLYTFFLISTYKIHVYNKIGVAYLLMNTGLVSVLFYVSRTLNINYPSPSLLSRHPLPL